MGRSPATGHVVRRAMGLDRAAATRPRHFMTLSYVSLTGISTYPPSARPGSTCDQEKLSILEFRL